MSKRILLDENIAHQLRPELIDHDVFTVAYIGFAGLKNGELLRAAENAGFEVLVTGDLSLEYQQNMDGRKISIVSLSANSWKIIKPQVAIISDAINRVNPGEFVRVECGRLNRRRRPGS